MREFTEYEETLMRMWMRERGYSEEYIENMLTSLREIAKQFGYIPAADVVRAAYWGKSRHIRRRRVTAVNIYERWLLERI